jgi:hypothetical protein
LTGEAIGPLIVCARDPLEPDAAMPFDSGDEALPKAKVGDRTTA